MAGAVLACFLVLVLFGAVGLRGTDQYWYVGDISMQTELGRYASNLLYPSYSLSNGTTQLPPPIHHVPIVYLAQLWAELGLQPYDSWVLTNLLAMLLAAAFIFGAARMLKLGRLSVLPVILFVSFPLTYWHTVNALADMALAVGAAGLLFGTLRAEIYRSRSGLLIAALSATFLVWSRDDFALVLLAFLGYCAWLVRARGWGWRFVTPVAVATVVLAPLKALALPKHPSNGLRGALSSQETMDFYYGLPEFSLQALAEKGANGLVNALLPAGATEVLTELPVLLAMGFGLWVTRKHSQYSILRFWTAVFFVTYVAACVLFQAQNRYILPVIPATSVVFVAGLRVWLERHPVVRDNRWGLRIAALSVVMLFVATSAMMARQYRAEANTGTEELNGLASDLAARTSGPLLAIGDSAEIIPLAYAVLPRPVLAVDPRVNGPLSAGELISEWGVVYVLGSDDDLAYLRSAVDRVPGGAELESKGVVHTPGGDLELWSIK